MSRRMTDSLPGTSRRRLAPGYLGQGLVEGAQVDGFGYIAVKAPGQHLFVKSLGSQGAQAMSSGIGQQAAAAIAAVPTKGMSLAVKGKAAYSGASGYAKSKIANYQAEKKRKRDMYRY